MAVEIVMPRLSDSMEEGTVAKWLVGVGDAVEKGQVLVEIDEKSYQGGTNGDHHPMSWYHDFDGGRAWYTNMGHTEATYTEPLFLRHLLGGLRYAMGAPAPR